MLSTLLHGAVLASLSWIPIARGAVSVEAGDEADGGSVIQLRLRPASTQPSAQVDPEPAAPSASDAEVASEPEAAPPPPEVADAPIPQTEPAFEIEPEPSPEPLAHEAVLAPPEPVAPVVTTSADEAAALAQGPTPRAPEASERSTPPSEEKPTAPPANPTADPTAIPAPAASAPKPASMPGAPAPKDAGASDLGALDDGFHLRALRSDRPEYPEDARRRGEQGTVTCRLTIDRDGRVAEVELLVSSGSPALDRAAVRALKRWRFEPLARITERERVHAVQKLSFELKSARP